MIQNRVFESKDRLEGRNLLLMTKKKEMVSYLGLAINEARL